MGRPRKPPAEKAKTLPARYRQDQRIASWNLDWRSPIAIRVMSELLVLANDLGGWDTLSRQKQILVEKITFLHLKTVEYETAVLEGQPPPFESGVYSNKVNVLQGLLRTVGLERKARAVRTLREVMEASAS
jgi:hypothetical protein